VTRLQATAVATTVAVIAATTVVATVTMTAAVAATMTVAATAMTTVAAVASVIKHHLLISSTVQLSSDPIEAAFKWRLEKPLLSPGLCSWCFRCLGDYNYHPMCCVLPKIVY